MHAQDLLAPDLERQGRESLQPLNFKTERCQTQLHDSAVIGGHCESGLCACQFSGGIH